ncbi:hypothetical protein BESB_071260 [Besnoitia besnoiti]|uniref:PX domain-containing protein n=1 Tax=Besnoitia besnoiti TaxID=94643 RepID=A0A2A9M9U2_BESBE|nr:uncharacterized protein BESB_071260 [Besnoitia besnoiti]PFH33974.1 hypothetical protein BESB_071260 [Besnoitia besnoiti]
MAGSSGCGATPPTGSASTSPSGCTLSPDTGGASLGSTVGSRKDVPSARGLEGHIGGSPQTVKAGGSQTASLVGGRGGSVGSFPSKPPERPGSSAGSSIASSAPHHSLSITPHPNLSGPVSSAGGIPRVDQTGVDSDSSVSRASAPDFARKSLDAEAKKLREEGMHGRSHTSGRTASGASAPSPYHVSLPEPTSSSTETLSNTSLGSTSYGSSGGSLRPPAAADSPPHQRRGPEQNVAAPTRSSCPSAPSASAALFVPSSVPPPASFGVPQVDRLCSPQKFHASVSSAGSLLDADKPRTVLSPCQPSSAAVPLLSQGAPHPSSVDFLSVQNFTAGPSTQHPIFVNGKNAPSSEPSKEYTTRAENGEEDDDFLGDSFVVVEAVEGREEAPGCAFSPPPLRFPSHCFSADGLWDSEGSKGDFAVSVSDPETRSTGPLGRFTLYLVSGLTVGGVPFACRKRYSDFEWLRQQLVQSFPGVFVPPIPRKQKLGRFDNSFVENRRQGLQEFLQRLFSRRHLAKCSIFVGWLTRSAESGMDQFKKDFAARSLAEQLEEFQETFRAQLEGANGRGTRAESDRFIVFKQFLAKQLTILEELHRQFSRLASLSRSQFGCVSALQNLLRDTCAIEENLVRQLPDLPIPAVRCDLASLVSLQRACLVASPAHNYDVMQQVVAKEFDDTECMLEAVGSLERLVQLKHQAQAQIGREETSLRSVLRSSRGSWLQAFVHRKDKDAQISELRASLDALKMQVQVLEQWAEASRLVWVNVEMPKLVTAKSIAFTRAAQAFIDRQQQQFLQEARVWQAYGIRTGASDPQAPSTQNAPLPLRPFGEWEATREL